MKVKSAPIIYGILILGSGYGLLSTLFVYSTYPHIVKETRISKIHIPKNISTMDINAESIYSRNIFNIEGTIPSEGQVKGGNVQCASASVSPLPYDVVGIIYGGNSNGSVAMLENRNTKEIVIVKNGSKLQQKGLISNIEATRVWISTTGCPSFLELPKFKLPSSRTRRGNAEQKASDTAYSEPGFERIGNDTTVTRQWVNDILTNKLAAVLNDALATPHMVNGRIDGFTISQIEPMSVYDKLGFKNGDIVTSVNGIPLNDAGQAIQTLNALRNEGNIEMEVVRNGKPVTFHTTVQ